MNAKLTYLLLGVLIKQTIDEFKAIAQKNYDELQKHAEREAASVGFCSELAERMQTATLAAEVRNRYSARQRFWKYFPSAVYLLLTISLFCYVLTLP